MTVNDIDVGKLKPYPRNAKKHPDKQVQQIAESIRKFGWAQPLAINSEGVIIIGHGRYEAAKLLGLETVPCVMIDDLSEEEIRMLRLADNKLNESEWDNDILKLELDDLDFGELDLDWEFDDTEIEPTAVYEDDPALDMPAEAVAKYGDIYQLGRHRLMCGDSMKADDIKVLMDGARADMVLSDPPYGMHLDTDFSGIRGSLQKNHTHGNKYDAVIGDNEDFTPDLINTIFRNFPSCKEMFLFGADYYAELIPDRNSGSWLVWDKRKESQADAIGSEFELIWSKTRHKRRVLRHDWFGFLSSEDSQDARNRIHPTQKPVSLLADIINQWGGRMIVDLYGGSGSTLIACEQMDKTCYMMEINPRYADLIIDRWEQFTGEKAVKLNG